ncbi:hypothetical protein TNCV_456281 [Trichonephila clavipes]|nr:hypothetical protein TNCV_456281 [Trichonephila clavipes]
MDRTETHCVSIDGSCLSWETGASEDGVRLLQRGNGDEVDQRPNVRTSLLSRSVREGPELLLVPHQWATKETEGSVQTFWGLPIKSDERHVVDPPM